MAETQEMRYKKKTIITFRIPSTLSPPKFPLMMWLSPFFVMMCSLTKSFPSKMMHLHCCSLLEYSSVFSYYALDTAL